jgi:hypothetical protein
MKFKLTKKKSLIILLVLSSTIAFASAAVYYSILAQPTVNITRAPVQFVKGSDWPAASSLGDNGTWVGLSLAAYPNATLTYDQPLAIKNVDTTAHSFKLTPVSVTTETGVASDFNFIDFTVKDNTGNTVATFDYTQTGGVWTSPDQTSSIALAAGTTYTVEAQTRANPSANTGQTSIQMSIDVTQ